MPPGAGQRCGLDRGDRHLHAASGASAGSPSPAAPSRLWPRHRAVAIGTDKGKQAIPACAGKQDFVLDVQERVRGGRFGASGESCLSCAERPQRLQIEAVVGVTREPTLLETVDAAGGQLAIAPSPDNHHGASARGTTTCAGKSEATECVEQQSGNLGSDVQEWWAAVVDLFEDAKHGRSQDGERGHVLRSTIRIALSLRHTPCSSKARRPDSRLGCRPPDPISAAPANTNAMVVNSMGKPEPKVHQPGRMDDRSDLPPVRRTQQLIAIQSGERRRSGIRVIGFTFDRAASGPKRNARINELPLRGDKSRRRPRERLRQGCIAVRHLLSASRAPVSRDRQSIAPAPSTLAIGPAKS